MRSIPLVSSVWRQHFSKNALMSIWKKNQNAISRRQKVLVSDEDWAVCWIDKWALGLVEWGKGGVWSISTLTTMRSPKASSDPDQETHSKHSYFIVTAKATAVLKSMQIKRCVRILQWHQKVFMQLPGHGFQFILCSCHIHNTIRDNDMLCCCYSFIWLNDFFIL